MRLPNATAGFLASLQSTSGKPQKLKSGLNALTSCKYWFTPTLKVSYAAQTLMGERSLTGFYLKDQYKRRDKQTLWCDIDTSLSNLHGKTVRHRSKRRIRAAWWAALAERGFDPDGKLRGDRLPGLKGSVEIRALEQSLLLPHNDMKSEMHKILEHVTKHQARETR